ncbi:MAG: sulfatase-like hydrolase/transferase [Candidatus Poribacteria bacterium]|nr:sulfatase-like hydrolase/transferase [Candidatus Poribacteria bacterium]
METKPVNKFLLISIDCWRYDALSRTNSLFNTPKLDLLTKDFSLAEKFFVAAPATRPSHTSYFTGLYPFEHGVYGQTYLKMFEGIPNLFQLFADAGYHITGRSERAEVFRFLDYESFITPIDPNAKAQQLGSLEDVIQNLKQPSEIPQFCFLHFWYTHGGYGMSGIPGAPSLGSLVKHGRTDEALRFYYAAATHILEFKLVEILKQLDLPEWAVFIFGDHGEGICDEIIDHGSTLNQNVLHVPLLAHIPGVETLKFPNAPISAIDLFSTITKLAGIETDYHGYGQDLLSPSEIDHNRLVLSELDSLYGIGFLSQKNLEMPHHRVTSRTTVDNEEINRYSEGVRLWSLTDGEYLYREDEQTGEFVYRHIMSGENMTCEDPERFRDAYDEILMNSNYQHLQAQTSTPEEKKVLEGRLRNLGYIE